jgi:hypothetical protein
MFYLINNSQFSLHMYYYTIYFGFFIIILHMIYHLMHNLFFEQYACDWARAIFQEGNSRCRERGV